MKTDSTNTHPRYPSYESQSFPPVLQVEVGTTVALRLVFGGGLVVFAVLRQEGGESEMDLRPPSLTNRLGRSQVVESVDRPMEVFRPPVPKPEPPRLMAPTNPFGRPPGCG